MSDLQLRQGGEVTRFDPAKTHAKLALLDGEIVTARRLKDWPKLEDAAVEKVAEIENFVDNWDRHVIPVAQYVTLGGRISGTKTLDVAETEWHISNQTTLASGRSRLNCRGGVCRRVGPDPLASAVWFTARAVVAWACSCWAASSQCRGCPPAALLWQPW